jgi:MFS family permease
LAAGVFATVLLSGLLPSPLYVLYQARLGFSAGLLTTIFAVYAAGVIVALLLAGGASDRIGRRGVLNSALAVGAGSAVVFLVAPGVAGLLAGRVLSGLSIGLALGTGSAYLAELYHARAAPVAAAATTGGLGAGSLLAGGLAEYAPLPTVLPYLAFLTLLALAGIALRLAPETVTRTSAGLAGLRPQRLGVPAGVRAGFTAAAAAVFAAFATFGMFASLAPSFLRDQLHNQNHFLAGAVVFVIFAAAAAVQATLGRLPPRRAVRLGAMILPAGLGLVVLALGVVSVAALVAAAVIAGSAIGLLLTGSLAIATTLAPPERRGQVLSTYFVAAYLGVGLPSIGLGLAIDHVSPLAAAAGFAVIFTALVAAAGASARTPRRNASGSGEDGGG